MTLLWKIPGSSQRLATWNDGHLDKWRRVFQQPAHGGMTCLVVGDDLFFILGDEFPLLLQTAYNAVHSIEEILLADPFFVLSRCDQGRFVAYVGNVRTGESRRLFGQKINIDVGIELQWFEMHFEYLASFPQFWQIDVDQAIEASGTHQGAIEDVRTVGGGQYDDMILRIEAVHLR
ncbi:MAG: Uncharacterised protein [Flavobacteriia bacterium]|nr:MAG: Uncharacterised protein [Flavobacteriia bacterium]